AAGDTVLFYSDGITEARNAQGEFFSSQRLLDLIAAQPHSEPDHLLDAVRRAVVDFCGTEACADDMTGVVVMLDDTGRELAHAQDELTSDVAELPRLRAFVRKFCQALPVRVLDEESLCQLELATTEAASNIMRHAYGGRTDQRLQLAADAFTDRIVIRLSHRGTAFDPATVTPPAFDGSREGGFGVYIINHSVDEARYVRDEHGNNHVYLVKKRTLQPERKAEWN